ncbi:MAG: Rod shape-determining protein MreC [Parcubacteria group bacterium]|nr:Rod shape-determining protein MreC [Parcubacteria group bacterium]
MAVGVITGIILLLLILRFFVPSVLSVISRPFWGVGSALTSFVHVHSPAESKASLVQARDQLSADNAALTAQNAGLSAKVADLTALLGNRVEPAKGIVANVIARPPVAPYDVLIIDQGTNAGVRIGAQAQGAGGTPIGTVGETDAGQSRITLYSTHGIKTNGWVGSTRIPLTLTGAGAGAFIATVPKAAGVQVGDGVYLAGNGALPVGTVTNIETDPSSPTVDLDMHPYTNPFSLTWVTISKQ